MLARAGCVGTLIGFESLDRETLRKMRKNFNAMGGGYEVALQNLRRHQIRVYATFVFGYENDTAISFDNAVDFAIDQRFYIAAFNHLTPFPATPLYERLKQEGRLRMPAWWLDERYRYNDVPFTPRSLAPEELTRLCVQARRRFYSWGSIIKRGMAPTNRSNAFMFRNFFPINAMHRTDIDGRNGYPLGDETWQGPLIEVAA